MEKLVKTSLKMIEKINYKKYGWVLTTASIVALIFYQRGKDDHEDQKSKKETKNNEQNSRKQEEKQQNDQKKQKKEGVQEGDEDQKISSSKQLNSSQNIQNKASTLSNLKDQKMQQIQQNLKKQMHELDKKSKKSNPNSSSSSLLRSSKGKFNGRNYDEEQTNYQTPQPYAMSDVESRQNLQMRNQLNLKKQRKYITDIDEPQNSYKRNQILKIARDQNPNDGLFFQMLASLAENEEENE